MQELITIQNQPALVEVNFEELKKHLATELEKYNVVVTQDTVKDAKALATELNATKREIAKRKKEEYDRATAGANQFKDSMKELETMCEDGRQKLLAQVQKFEDETRQLGYDLMVELRAKLWDSLGVNDEFRRATIDEPVPLSAVTTKGNLSASAKNTIEARVNADKALQDQTEMRLLKLENQSYKAGLSAPLNRGHVEHFLFLEDAEYNQKLDALMQSELQREEVAQQRMRDQMEREQREKERQEQMRAEREQRQQAAAQEAAPTPEAEHKEAPKAEPAPDQASEKPAERPAPGKVPVTVQCTFSVNVGERVTDAAIEAELRSVMEKAGIKTLASVQVFREQEAA
ncbi:MULTISPECIES: DUF1351 domain-containing protein [unclassified Marinobacter]|uniref:DUF1351 domain-containing protein n=1 Tax=unclassified Marinobacter TaxID=83889 RepID=UPI00192620C9|nr:MULTISPECIES: DUF1351 domain-containing protein [unclassified Marinobacter]MBL3825121.1 DUF1351 domain-containing protein [Marinobacter sp. MC3]MBL3893675.1 DUF1351 domain-containing protein [Marinobacter sp. MW3]